MRSLRMADRVKAKPPRIEFRLISGELLECIPFCSMFEWINNDPDLD